MAIAIAIASPIFQTSHNNSFPSLSKFSLFSHRILPYPQPRLPLRRFPFISSLNGHHSFTPPVGNPGHSVNMPTSASAFSTSPSPAATSPVPAVRRAEEIIEMSIFNCRFFTLMGIAGSLAGSVLCFLKGCFYVAESFLEYYHSCWNNVGTGKVILLLVEAVDVYLMGTVMLIFGMGLYELFVSSLDVPGGDCFSSSKRTTVCGSNLFGLFSLRERPKWLEIRSLDELKTKLGHVIVMILLVGMFEKSKIVPINSGLDLLCFSASILFSSGCLFFLSKLHPTK